MAEIRILARRTWRGTGYGNHSAIQNTVHGYQKWQKGANNGLVGGRFQGLLAGYKGMSSRHAMLSKQCVLYLGVRVKQAVSLVGEDLCEACKQSNKTIASDDVTWSKWIYSMTVLDRHQQLITGINSDFESLWTRTEANHQCVHIGIHTFSQWHINTS